jgi:hypothetical protein
MPSFTLTDIAHDLWVEGFAITSADLELPAAPPWSVIKRTLRGGRRDGVDLIQVNNGALAFAVIPTRGMGLWRGQYQGDFVGWDSPVADGPVHPSFVNLMSGGGLGWLEGFDELLVRCGLENNGAPYEEKKIKPDGSESHTTFGLHGKIANIPAQFVAVHVAPEPPYEITVEGHVEEAKLFSPQVRMVTKISTTPGSNRVTVRDEFHNLKESRVDMQVLYHWNFGAPYLEEGSSLVVPTKAVVPRDRRAQEGMGHYDVFGAPEPGFTEQVYFFELHGESRDGRTLAVLRNHAGDKAVALRFAKSQLPAFTLWKNTSGRKEGYVTGLEPATNYPNPKPFEKAHQRVVTLPPGGRFLAETTLEVCNTKQAVADVEQEVRKLQGQGAPKVHQKPIEPFAPEG